MENFFIKNTLKVNQIHNGYIFIGKITFKELNKIHRLTERKENLVDPFSQEVTPYTTEEEFQRQLSTGKLKRIKNYLYEEFTNPDKPLGLYPSSIIISLSYNEELKDTFLNSLSESDQTLYNKDVELPDELKDRYKKMIVESYEVNNNLSYLIFKNDDNVDIIIPQNEKIALIVDGQHRFYGMKMLFEEFIKIRKNYLEIKDIENIKRYNTYLTKIINFEFITTFLLGFDIYEIGKIFAVVNFTQKPVNRSLYYDIFGSVPETEKNDIKLAHDLALHLNNNAESPINGMIKLLGKGYGLFSQAFFVEKILIHFKYNGVWENIYADYNNSGVLYKELPIFMKLYLNCIKEAYPSAWPNKVKRGSKEVYSPFSYDFILCKTTGLGAYFRLITQIFKIYESNLEKDRKNAILEVLKKISDEEAKELFSRTGPFGLTGSEGIQVKLYDELLMKFGFPPRKKRK